ncbi:MAG: gliding motility-associated C-terminal domain-containing protein, partial [Bacteroidia bacterium]|nr:gliding motility-associated C-terminal domain-containing protein [Bacteroidia bacterium]
STNTLTINAATIADGGTYAVTVTSNNCTSAPQTVNVIVNPLPLANATNTGGTYCSGNTITLNASGGTSYNWTGPNSFTSSQQNPNINSSITTNSGVYTVVVTDANGCSATDTANVTVNQTPLAPTANANASNLCEGQTLQLNSNSTGSTSYTWIGPNGFNSSQQNPNINNASVLQSGTYIVFGTSADGCNSDTTQINITINTNPIANASVSANNICSGNTVNLNANGGGTYSWAGPNSYSSNAQNPTLNNVQVNSSGTYTVTVTNAANCTDTASVNFTVIQTPNAALVNGDTTCSGTTLNLTANGTGTINWYNDAALTNLIQSDSSNYSPVLATNSFATYYVTVTSNGCTSTISTVSAGNYSVTAGVTANPTTGFIPLNVLFTNQSTGVTTSDNFSWNVGNTNFASTYDANYIFTNSGNYTITLITTDNESGCTDTATVLIVVNGDVTFSVPNVFTPNGDGNNDVFYVSSEGLKELKVMIFDRWGLKMYEYEGINGSWDGRTTAGVEVSDGTYYFILEATGVNGKEFLEKGAILVSRN